MAKKNNKEADQIRYKVWGELKNGDQLDPVYIDATSPEEACDKAIETYSLEWAQSEEV